MDPTELCRYTLTAGASTTVVLAHGTLAIGVRVHDRHPTRDADRLAHRAYPPTAGQLTVLAG